jgi:8-oxo-dGTP diphosphatase
MSGVVSQSGDELVLYRPGEGLTVLDEYPDLPLVFACVVARCRGEILFVFNNYRQLWELPAGHIDAGESPEAAGIRELMEESGQGVSALSQAGLALMRMGEGELEPGVMFTCQLAALQPFTPNAEIREIMLWDMQRPVSGEVDHVSRKLVELMSV